MLSFFFNSLKSCSESTLDSLVLCQEQNVVPLLRHAKESLKIFWSVFFPTASTVLILKYSILGRWKRAWKTFTVIHSSNVFSFYSSKWKPNLSSRQFGEISKTNIPNTSLKLHCTCHPSPSHPTPAASPVPLP